MIRNIDLIADPCKSLARRWLGGQKWLRQLPFDESERTIVDGHLRLLEAMAQELARVEKCLAIKSYPSEDVRLLMTLPGVGPACAQALCAALGDWCRFRADRAVSYLGLCPSRDSLPAPAATDRSPKPATRTLAGS